MNRLGGRVFLVLILVAAALLRPHPSLAARGRAAVALPRRSAAPLRGAPTIRPAAPATLRGARREFSTFPRLMPAAAPAPVEADAPVLAFGPAPTPVHPAIAFSARSRAERLVRPLLVPGADSAARGRLVFDGQGQRPALRADALVSASAQDRRPRQTAIQRVMLRLLKQVATLFTEKYAPIELKTSKGVDFVAEYRKIRAWIAVDLGPTLHAYWDQLANFTAAARDYHAGISFDSTESASLPLRILGGAEGRYFIDDIDRDALPESVFPYRRGDEVLKFGGVPIAQAVAALIRVPNMPETDARWAQLELTRRSRRGGRDVPQGEIALEIKPAQGEPRQALLRWDYKPELIRPDVPVRESDLGPEQSGGGAAQGATPPVGRDDPRRAAAREAIHGLLGRAYAESAAALLGAAEPRRIDPGNPVVLPPLGEWATRARLAGPRAGLDERYQLNGKKSFVPALGELVARLPDEIADTIPFDVAIYKDGQGRRIGYLRIPSFDGGEVELAVLKQLVSMLEENTDALVLDLVNNPGGRVDYTKSVLSLFATEPMALPKQQMMIDSRDVRWAVELLEQAKDEKGLVVLKEELKAEGGGEGKARELEDLLNLARYVRDQFNAHGKRLTEIDENSSFFGSQFVYPASVRYAKPLFVLINELCFSAADFAPAVFQDNGRAVLFGARTAGAGGAVKSVEPENQLGISRVSFTWTLAKRVLGRFAGQYIEGVGVGPDVPYALAEEDFRADYAGYRRALLAAIAARVPAPPRSPAASSGPA